MIAATRCGRPKTALCALTIVLLIASCHCHPTHPRATWIGTPGYNTPDSNKYPLKNQVVVWKDPNATEDEFQEWLIQLKNQRSTVQALAVCAHCDSDMLLLYDTSLLPYLQNQTVGSNGGSGGPTPQGDSGPTLFCTNYPLSSPDSTPGRPIGKRLPSAINLTWPKPKTDHPLVVAVFDSGLDSAGQASVATVPSTCFETPAGMSSQHGWNFWDNNANTHDDMPDEHGTIVTRLIMDQVQNYGGGDVSILPVKIFNSNGQGTLFGVLCGLAYASGAGAKIVNASFGFYHYTDSSMNNNLQVEHMMDGFLTKYLNGTGMLLVAAAGNDDSNEDTIFNRVTHSTAYRYLDSNRFYPAWFAKTYNNVISVTTASRTTQAPSPLENYSSTVVDAGAQCDTIFGGAYLFFNPIIPRQNNGNGYSIQTITGSSFAAPIITGRIAALYSTLPSKTDKHVFIPAMNITKDARTVLQKDPGLKDSIINGELAP